MTRMYLSPTATVFAKIGLLMIEALIGLFNLIMFPIRKINLKSYGIFMLIYSFLYVFLFNSNLEKHLMTCVVLFAIFSISIIVTKILYKLLNKKIMPRIAYMLHSPLGIKLNRFYTPAAL